LATIYQSNILANERANREGKGLGFMENVEKGAQNCTIDQQSFILFKEI